ncbi:hypothetical protein [uncultured Shewanella sp.]|uniref:hypothetical protein n=1 Tax=uncultured Shewanella sp. TaxID=173975 RepID=UPI002633F9FE|nr:hypothetical protein [uncultured Shewanella sp.]
MTNLSPPFCLAKNHNFIPHFLDDEFIIQFMKGKSGFEDGIMGIDPHLDSKNMCYWIEWTEDDCRKFWFGFIDVLFNQLIKAKEKLQHEIVTYVTSDGFNTICKLIGLDQQTMVNEYYYLNDQLPILHRLKTALIQFEKIWSENKLSQRYRFKHNLPLNGIPNRILKLCKEDQIISPLKQIIRLSTDLYVNERYDEHDKALRYVAQIVGSKVN